MSLIDKVADSNLGLKGVRPGTLPGSKGDSNTHAQGPVPYQVDEKKSRLDLDGKTPKRYLDNPPR